MRILKEEILGSLPPIWPQDLRSEIQALVREMRQKIVVLDDDPTGTQTIHGVPVLTEWSVDSLAGALSEPDSVFYILTNSRSLSLPEAQRINKEIAANLRAARSVSGRDFVVVSRGDSTLRGHFPGEVEALMAGLGQAFDGILIVPFFLEGGRFTVDDVHYVAEGEWLIPAAETEYARDAAFGYQSSNLRSWVSEKHKGVMQPGDVASISLKELRLRGPEWVAAALAPLRDGQMCVVNAASYRDLDVVVAGLLRAEAGGRRFIYRTAASFIRSRAGIAPRDLLAGADLSTGSNKNGGLIIAGSYVQRSSAQIETARSLPGVTGLELSVEKVIDPSTRDAELVRMSKEIDEALAAGNDTLVYTSRHLVTDKDGTSALQIGQTISGALVELVDLLAEQPAWIIAKGGITSSDIATKALNVKRAAVLGQSLPGVPIWRTGPESRWPGMIYVVFPGNVGGPETLADMVRILRGEP
ncbi:MAG: hypothetical protein M1358_06050 [Chloroflexi bacterium]|nr:hypothetical protein [Chloroflexota bacterium]